MMPQNYSVFKTSEGESEYKSAYDEMLKHWPVPYESTFVNTSFGETHIITCGTKELPPLLLLHGAGGSSTMWFENIKVLSFHYRTYCIDVLGEVGKSIVTKRMIKHWDCALWLTEVLNELKIEKACIAGHSKGGWLALNLAHFFPERVAKLALLAPAYSFIQVGLGFYLEMIKVMIFCNRKTANQLLRWLSAEGFQPNKLYEEQFFLGLKHLRINRAVVPNVLSDGDLRNINVPVLLLMGSQEKLYNPDKAVERAKRLMSSLEAATVPGTGHMVLMEKSNTVNKLMLEFLGRQ